LNLSDYVSIAVIVGAVNGVFIFLGKLLAESTVKHAYDRKLEETRAEWRRTDVLYVERLATFKLLQKKLVSVRRYCDSVISSELGAEFGRRTDELDAPDRKSLLTHWTELEALLDENLIFLSDGARAAFERLRDQLSVAAGMELALASAHPPPEVLSSKADGYAAVRNRVTECIGALFLDLSFPGEK
jgi:hypothetical protein